MRFCLALIIVALLINAVVDAGRKKNKEKGSKADRRIKAVCSVGKYFLSTQTLIQATGLIYYGIGQQDVT